MPGSNAKIPNSITSLDGWVYLLDWILAVILGIAFVFYFSRLVGFILSLTLKFTLWKHYKVNVSFNAFRVSPLGGRITATNIVVSNADYTISILQLNLTWRYWLLSMTRIAGIFFSQQDPHAEEIGLTAELNKSLVTAVELQIDGLEIFMYNREAAYKNIVENLEKLAKELDSDAKSDVSKEFSTKVENFADLKTEESKSLTSSSASSYRLLRLLPIGIRVRKGAFVLGNHTTPYILVCSFTSAVATIDAVKSPSPLDHWRLNFDIMMEKFQASLKSNITYNPNKYSASAPLKSESCKTLCSDLLLPIPKKTVLKKGRDFISRVILRRKDKSEQTSREWRGLRRYVGDFKGEPIIEIDSIEEYGKCSLILDSAATQLTYYYDLCGQNPEASISTEIDTFPHLGVDILLTTATINYGSWADRQRGPLHALLFPQFARDTEPSDFANSPGVLRRYAGFKFLLKTTDELVVRIPTREFSKDREELRTQTGITGQKQTRPFGWLEISTGSSTEISMFSSYLPSTDGSANSLDVKLSEVELRTSVTHDLLFLADTHVIKADLNFPLKWNAECIWDFSMESSNGVAFFLSEHIALFSDIMADFGSGPPPKYEFFRPFVYSFNWQIQQFHIYLNVNDGNVFDDPLDFDANSYLCFQGDALEMNVTIPVKGSFAKYSKIGFLFASPNIQIVLDVPPSHTVGSFMNGNKLMGSSGPLEVTGYYKINNNVEVNHSNLAFLEVDIDDVTMLFYGYLVRYFFVLRENYFGDSRTFQTCDEYLQTVVREEEQQQKSQLEDDKDPDYWGHYKLENDLDVIFSFLIHRGLLVFPCAIYDYAHHIGLLFNTLDVDIHLTNYYMDLQTDFSPVDGYYFKPGSCNEHKELVFDRDAYVKFLSAREPEFIIDTFSVHTHRMLGLDLNTYQCKWDFAAEDFLVRGDPACLTGLFGGIQAFVLGFKDYENTHKYRVPIIYDAANFSFRCPKFAAKLQTESPDLFLHVCVTDILLSFNDMANLRYSDRITILLPEIVAEIINTKDNNRSMHAHTSLVFNNICQKATMLQHRRAQQNHIRRNDAPTHRAPFLVFTENRDEVYNGASGSRYPPVSLPTASIPLTCDDFDTLCEQFSRLSDPLSVRSEARLSRILCQSLEVESIDSEYVEPTVHYANEDFVPQTQTVPDQKTDAFILEFDPIKAIVSPSALLSLSEIALASQTLDLGFLIDRLQCLTVKSIIVLIRLLSVVTNIRFVCSEISVRLSDAADVSIDVSAEAQSCVTLTITDPSVVASYALVTSRNDYNVYQEVSVTGAAHVQKLKLALTLPDCSSAFSLQLKDLEAWFDKSDTGSLVSSTSSEEIDITLQEPFLTEALSFCILLAQSLEPALANFKMYVEAADTWKKQLALLLSPSADILEQQLDPKVITKSSRLHRSVMDHVRSFDSWRIVSKFRSILDDLPAYGSANEKFLSRTWDVPADSLGAVNANFRGWRTWEGNMDERRHFFESLFEGEREPLLYLNLVLKLANVGVSLLRFDDCKDFLSFRDLTLSSGTKNSSQTELLSFDPDTERSCTETHLNVLECDVSLSPRILSVAEVLQKIQGDLKLTKKETTRYKNEPNASTGASGETCTYVSVVVDSFHFHIALPQTVANFYFHRGWCTLLLMPGEVSCALKLGQNDFSVGREDLDFVNFNLRDTNAVMTASLKGSPIYVADIDAGEVAFEARNQKRLFCNFLLGMHKDMKQVQALGFQVFKSKQKAVPKNSEIPEILFRIEAHKTTFFFDIIMPLKLHILAHNGKFQAAVRKGCFDVKAGYRSVVFEALMADEPVMRMETSLFGSSFELTQLKGIWLVKASIDLGHFKTSVHQFLGVCEVFLNHRSMLESELKALKDAASIFSGESTQTGKANEARVCQEDYSPSIAFELLLSQEHWAFLTYKDQSTFSIEIERLSLFMTNYDQELTTETLTVPVTGEVACAAAKFSVIDLLFSDGLSTIIDVKMSAKLFNNAVDEAVESQSTQVVSEYFRVCLSPPILFKILDLIDSLKRLVTRYESIQKSKGKEQRRQREENEEKEGIHKGEKDNKEKKTILKSSPGRSSIRFLTFSSIHVLSYNFCFGWLFGSSYKDYPGFICGAERVFAVTKSDIGKLTMMGGYFSVAHGYSASSFFSTSSEIHGLNRAYMPTLQVNYFVDSSRRLWINLKGDQLDARFMSDFKIAIERTVKSIADVQKYLESRLKTAQMRSKLVPKSESNFELHPNKSFNLDFSGVEVTIGFAGSKILLYRLRQNDYNNVPSQMTLHSPAMLTVILYETQKHSARKHKIIAEMLISRSDNTLDPSCVPVVTDFTSALKSLLLSPQTTLEKRPGNRPEQGKKAEKASGLSDVRNLLKDFDFIVGIYVEPQRVSLSCEPVAKVAAVVEFEEASLTISSGLETSDMIHAVAKIQSISASLQHIYSDERSGNIEVRSILFSNVISLVPQLENFSSISVSGINGYVRMKQYQDVDLFSDIWFPSERAEAKDSKSAVSKPELSSIPVTKSDLFKTSSSGSGRRPSAMLAILVQLDFIVSKISIEIDFGSALGTVCLTIDRAWAVLQKLSAWHYALRIGLQTLAVDFHGRLGGYLQLNKLFLNSSIEWKIGDLPVLDVPLIHMAGGFGQISLKGIFDDHVFAFVNLYGWFFDVYNRKNGIDISKDHLRVCLNYESVDVGLTSLLASDFYDIYSTVLRMIEENRTSYREILKDSNEDNVVAAKMNAASEAPMKKLETKIDVVTGVTRVLVFPHSFVDTRVFALVLDLSKATFSQSGYSHGVMNQIELQLNNVIASFSGLPGVADDYVNGVDVAGFVAYMRKARGGEIISLPKFMISMRTHQKAESILIEYMFQSSFGGTVNIRWNLGSVNYVREMYAAHKRALSSRTEASFMRPENKRADTERGTDDPIFDSSTDTAHEPELPDSLEPGQIHKDFDQDLQDTLEQVSTKSKYTYKALAPPIIEAPQLRELGNATPPLEWFGLHRNKFPDAVHQIAIVSLQKVIQELERQYSKTLS